MTAELTWGTGLATVAALAAAGWMWQQQYRAQAAARLAGPIAIEQHHRSRAVTVVGAVLSVAVKVIAAPSSRSTIALATGAGMVVAGKTPAPTWLVEAIARAADLTGLDTAVWAPAGLNVVVLVLAGLAVFDLVVLGLWRNRMLRPALRHPLIGLLLPTLLVAGWPLLTQTTTDVIDAVGQVPAPAVCAPNVPGDTVAGYGPDRLANAAIIVQVGQEMGIPTRGQVLAVAGAMQESSLANLDYGDRDSLGLFQQRPSQGWGTPAQIQDPRYAATQFYTELQRVPGWRDLPGEQQLPGWQVIQSVQRSGHPTFYADDEGPAAEVVGAVTNTPCARG